MMSSDDVNEDDNIDDGMEFDGGYVEPWCDLESA